MLVMDNIPTIPEMLKASAEKFRGLTALQMKDPSGNYRKISYLEFYGSLQKISSFLFDSGIKHGGRIALLSENRPEWPMVYFGVTSIGAIIVPLDPKLESEELFSLLSDSGSEIAFCSGEQAQKIEKLRSRLPLLKKAVNLDADIDKILALPLDPARLRSPQACPLPLAAVAPDDIAAIIYTSGTTGNPKGVMLSHKNIMSNVIGIDPLFHMIGPGDNFLSILPNYHTFETTAGMFCPIFKGASITYAESLKSYHLLNNMQETKVTIICGVPLLYKLFLDGIKRQVEEKGIAARVIFRVFLCISMYFKVFLHVNIGRHLFGFIHKKFGRHIKFFVSGGAPLDPKIIKEFDLMGFTILQGYGLTETSPILAACTLDNNVFGSVGRPLPGVDIKIHAPNREAVGEIMAKGPNIMKGYYNDPGATSEAIMDGWFRTGDLGRLDAKGNLYITGRSKDLIVLGSGKNVYPDEVEFVISKSPFIKEICVFGSKIMSGIRQGMEEVHAAIVPDMDKMADWVTKRGLELNDSTVRTVIGEEVENWGKLLTPHKRIARYYIAEGELPKTATKKIKRFAVKESYSK